jgi:FdhE protein
LSRLSLDAWVEAHPYLRPLARLTAEVAAAAGEIDIALLPVPSWEDYEEELRAGVPLLQSDAARIDPLPAAKMATALVARLSAKSSAASPLPADLSVLQADLSRRPDAPRRIADWLLGDDSFEPAAPGLLRYLAWTAMARFLEPAVASFALWRGDRWKRRYCPTCGSPPAMAQLIGEETGRIRLLCCGFCATRWRYVRTACPFCEHDSQRLEAVLVTGEGGLRIDYCESCKGYLKTYDGTGNEAVLLADWTSLHLDFVARDRGFERLAASLYDLDSVTLPQPA